MDGNAIARIAREVVTRLANRRLADDNGTTKPSSAQVDRFCDVLIGADERGAAQFVENLRSEGASLNTIYMEYIAGAAIRLGERWENDTSTFFEMTLASGRMYSIMRNIRRSIAPPSLNNTRHALFSAVPGECHTLGVTMASDMFRRRGWEIDTVVDKTHDELVDLISRGDHTFIGLSASRPSMAVELTRLIVDVRLCKPQAFIMVAGNITELSSDLENLVDADIIAHDAPSAVVEMEKIRRELRSSA